MNRARALSALFALGSCLLAVAACSSDAGGDDGSPASPASPASSGGGGAAGASPGATAFHGPVEAVIQKRCQSCHHAGGIAPFALTDYATARQYGGLIKRKMADRSMPPWGADDTADCKPPLPFVGDLRVPQDEIDLVARWVDEGLAEGNPGDAPTPPALADGSLSGVTDTLAFASEYTVEPGGPDQFMCFVIDPHLAETTYVSGVRVVADNPNVDHHVLVFTDPTGEALTKADSSGKYPCFGGPDVAGASLLTAWAPGTPASDFGDKVALEIAKGSVLIVQMHYHPTPSTAEKDRTKVELRRAPKAPEYLAKVRLIGNAESAAGPVKLLPGPDDQNGKPEFRIPAGAKGHTETMEYTLPKTKANQSVRLATVGAHMHWVGRDLKVEVIPADGGDSSRQCMLETPRYDFNWQRGYAFDGPLEQLPELHGGDTIRITCTYDNTTDNPGVVRALADQHLPAPVDVKLGESTIDEMCLGAFTFVVPAAASAGGPAGPVTAPEPKCDVSPVPADLPQIAGSFAAFDDAGGALPVTPHGGDPTGLWYVAETTVYLTGQASKIVDLGMSSVAGVGFYEFTSDGKYRLRVYTESSIVTSVAGTLAQTTDQASTGSFSPSAQSLELTPTCPEGAAQKPQLGFSVDGDTLTLLTQDSSSSAGKFYVVQKAKRAK